MISPSAELFKTLALNQYQAALCTLEQCLRFCPASAWDDSDKDYPFSQVLFHTLFYTDYYLGKNRGELTLQAFHGENKRHFRDYEELEDREPVYLYEQSFLELYLEHCLKKSEICLEAETEGSLAGPSGFERRNFTRMELHVYNIRHIQHHAAQLGLRIQYKTGRELAWVGSGWKNIGS